MSAVGETRSGAPTQPLRASTRWVPVWRRNLLVWRKLAIPSLLGNFGEPVLYLLALGYGLGSFVGEMGNVSYVVYLASGIVCSSAMVTASFESTYSAYTRMAAQRNWDAMLAAPLDVRDIVLGEVIWAATKSVISALAIMVVSTLLGLMQNWSVLLAIPVVMLTGLCFASMGMVVTAIARNYDSFLYYSTLAVTPMLLLGGVFFPLERMPVPVQHGADLLPLTHAVAVVRPLVTGNAAQEYFWHLCVVAGYALAALLTAIWLLRRRLTT